ncbi:uncharacterized protein L201_006691 [Kwoniella dendrophila CBS 6074]|uniref:F-box domain-containing protein n=1 Tax=Kwoniella dendrophila CBS 6074 TaxID=1295534 RepID=A0AAX4K3J6_9TREE
MSRTLLSLSDDIIHRIGYFLHQDNFIPLPSFHPHWANFASDINPKVATDYLAFSNTCKRVKKICPLKGLHIKLSKWSKLLKWIAYSPDQVRKGVHRIHLDISPRPGKSIISTWITLSTFFRIFPFLEELILIDTPLCRHYNSTTKLADIHILGAPMALTNLKSLAVDVNCRVCAETLPLFLIKEIEALQHLKAVDCSNLSLVLQTMSDNLTISDTSKHQPLSDHTLCFKAYPTLTDIEEMLDKINTTFPRVTELHLSPHHRVSSAHKFRPYLYVNNVERNYKSGEGLTLGLIQAHDVWSLKTSGSTSMRHDTDSLQKIIDSLARFTRLQVLDCGVAVIPEDGYWEHTSAKHGETLSEFMDRIKRWTDYSRIRSDLLSSVEIMFFNAIPSLSCLQLWDVDSDDWKYWTRFLQPEDPNEDCEDCYDCIPVLFTSSKIG